MFMAYILYMAYKTKQTNNEKTIISATKKETGRVAIRNLTDIPNIYA